MDSEHARAAGWVGRCRAAWRALRVLPIRFDDPVAEASFIQMFRSGGLPFARSAMALGIVAYAAFFLAEWQVPSHLGDGQTWRQLTRVGLMAMLGAVLIVSWMRTSLFLRHYVPIVFGLSAVALHATAVIGILDGVFAPMFYLSVLASIVFGLFLLYGFARLPVSHALLIGLSVMAAMLIYALTADDAGIRGWRMAVHLGAANFAGFVLACVQERRERELFSQSAQTTQTALELARRTGDVEKAVALRNRALSSLAHDLRQPLMALTTHAALLQAHRERLTPYGLGTSVDGVGNCVRALDTQLTTLLDISNAQAAASPANLQRVDLRGLIEEACQEFAPRARHLGIQWRVRMPLDGPLLGLTDRAQLARVISNLADNALKFASAPDRRPPWVVIAATRVGPTLRLHVIDNGIGIDPAHHARIFEECFQVDNTARQRSRGYGLGLALVRAHIDRLDGHVIHLSSSLGRGAHFQITVPRIATPNDSAEDSPLAAEGAGVADAYVLLVEDDEQIRLSVNLLLQSWGALTETCAGVDEALARIEHAERTFDAILTDYRLPGAMDGLRLAHALRHRYPGVPVLLTSGLTTPNEAAEEDILLLRKPYGLDDLRRAIISVLSKPGAEYGESNLVRFPNKERQRNAAKPEIR